MVALQAIGVHVNVPSSYMNLSLFLELRSKPVYDLGS